MAGRARRTSSSHGSWRAAYSQKRLPATYDPAASRSTRPVRSSAASIREVVDFASPLDSWRSAKLSGWSACTTVETSCAARSTACVPVLVSAMLPLLRFRRVP